MLFDNLHFILKHNQISELCKCCHFHTRSDNEGCLVLFEEGTKKGLLPFSAPWECTGFYGCQCFADTSPVTMLHMHETLMVKSECISNVSTASSLSEVKHYSFNCVCFSLDPLHEVNLFHHNHDQLIQYRHKLTL